MNIPDTDKVNVEEAEKIDKVNAKKVEDPDIVAEDLNIEDDP